jgi:hypothetical protein
MVIRETYTFESTANGRKTRLQVFTQVSSLPLPRWLKRLILKLFVAKKLSDPYFALAQLMAQDGASGLVDASVQTVT